MFGVYNAFGGGSYFLSTFDRFKFIGHASPTPSPWTAVRRRLYAISLPLFIAPQEEIEVAGIRSRVNEYATTSATAAICWWQLTRLYSDLGCSEELLGWLCDRWVTGSRSTRLLEHLGAAIVAKGLGDYEGAILQLSDVCIPMRIT